MLVVTECGYHLFYSPNINFVQRIFFSQKKYKGFYKHCCKLYIAGISNCVLPVDYATVMKVNEAIMCFIAVIHVVQRFYKYCCPYEQLSFVNGLSLVLKWISIEVNEVWHCHKNEIGIWASGNLEFYVWGYSRCGNTSVSAYINYASYCIKSEN